MLTTAPPSSAAIDREEVLRSIRNMVPLRKLNDNEFTAITGEMQIENRASGAEFFCAGRDDQFIFYLLSGDVAITNAEGSCYDIVGGSLESRRPLAPHPRDRVKAVARTQTSFVRFPADLMQLEGHTQYDTVLLDEITQADEALDKSVIFEVYHALMSNELVLPSLPDVALRIQEAANNENTSVEDVARVIGGDPSTAAYCVSIANNAAYAGAAEIDNVFDAVVRMGIQPTRDIVVAYTMRSLFAGTNPLSKKLMRDAWTHSCRIAALSYILARDVAKLSAERALLAGLLHDIGVTVVIREAQKHVPVMTDVDAFNHLCHELSGQVGAMVLRAWKFPDVFPAAALEAESFTKTAPDRLNLSDVVMLAHLHDEEPAPWSLKAPNLLELDIASQLGAQHVTDGHRLEVIEQANKELTELTRMLIS